MNILGLPPCTLAAWLGVGLWGRTGAGDPWPVAWTGVGLPGRTPPRDGTVSVYTVIHQISLQIIYEEENDDFNVLISVFNEFSNI